MLKADITNLFIPAADFTNIIYYSRRKSFIILAKVIWMIPSVRDVHAVSGFGCVKVQNYASVDNSARHTNLKFKSDSMFHQCRHTWRQGGCLLLNVVYGVYGEVLILCCVYCKWLSLGTTWWHLGFDGACPGLKGDRGIQGEHLLSRCGDEKP